MSRRLPYVPAIVLTVFLDILAFGMFIPDIQLRGELLVHALPISADATVLGVAVGKVLPGFLIGLLLALLSIAQLGAASVLGRLSDRVGRRKVLLFTTAMSMVGALVYTQAYSIEVLALSRVLMGLAAGNIAVAYAYISDVTPREDRAPAMGKLGIAFGLGFIFGPPIGGLLLEVGNDLPTLLGLVAAGLGLANFLYVYFLLPESLTERKEAPEKLKVGLWRSLVNAIRTPGFGYLLVLFFVANFAMSNMESTWFRLSVTVFEISKLEASLLLMEVGLVIAVVQGGLIRPLVKRFGEVRLLRAGYLLMAPALALMPWMHPWIPALFIVAVLAAGSGFATPTLSSLISKLAPAAIAGGVFGITHSLGALARIVGPVLGSSLFEIYPWLPYAVAGSLMLAPIVMSQRIGEPQPSPEPSGS